MTDQLDLDGLERLAKAATPGEWKRHYDEVRAGKVKVIADYDYEGLCIHHDPDFDYIAAANPATILALIAQAREAERMRGALVRLLEINEEWVGAAEPGSAYDQARQALAPATGGGDA